jgi:hypothetical protein
VIAHLTGLDSRFLIGSHRVSVAPDAIEHAVVLATIKEACAPLTRWPAGGPSLMAAARASMGVAQVGTKRMVRSNRRMEQEGKIIDPYRRHVCGASLIEGPETGAAQSLCADWWRLGPIHVQHSGHVRSWTEAPPVPILDQTEQRSRSAR